MSEQKSEAKKVVATFQAVAQHAAAFADTGKGASLTEKLHAEFLGCRDFRSKFHVLATYGTDDDSKQVLHEMDETTTSLKKFISDQAHKNTFKFFVAFAKNAFQKGLTVKDTPAEKLEPLFLAGVAFLC